MFLLSQEIAFLSRKLRLNKLAEQPATDGSFDLDVLLPFSDAKRIGPLQLFQDESSYALTSSGKSSPGICGGCRRGQLIKGRKDNTYTATLIDAAARAIFVGEFDIHTGDSPRQSTQLFRHSIDDGIVNSVVESSDLRVDTDLHNDFPLF